MGSHPAVSLAVKPAVTCPLEKNGNISNTVKSILTVDLSIGSVFALIAGFKINITKFRKNDKTHLAIQIILNLFLTKKQDDITINQQITLLQTLQCNQIPDSC